ncbi:hypothetical protein LCGC14_2516670 [marine sediment metagenome]|uniref:Uncharacterized protein n=1 Tax=marine sediment metagenome TaxID=412755 RepID=A0A0F9DR04_9ZZZZ
MKRILGFTIVTLLLVCLLFVGTTPKDSWAAAPTTAFSQVDEWEEVAQNAVRLGTITDISGNYKTVIAIDYSLSDATAHTGSKIEVQVSNATSGNEDWTTYRAFITLTGTQNLEAMGTEAAGQTVLEVTSTTGYVADETRWIFIEDNAVANSEMCLLISAVTDTSVTVLDGTTEAHTSADTLNNIADRVIMTIPFGFNRFRMIYDNTFDVDGATIHTHMTIVETTALPG